MIIFFFHLSPLRARLMPLRFTVILKTLFPFYIKALGFNLLRFSGISLIIIYNVCLRFQFYSIILLFCVFLFYLLSCLSLAPIRFFSSKYFLYLYVYFIFFLIFLQGRGHISLKFFCVIIIFPFYLWIFSFFFFFRPYLNIMGCLRISRSIMIFSIG